MSQDMLVTETHESLNLCVLVIICVAMNHSINPLGTLICIGAFLVLLWLLLEVIRHLIGQ